MEKVMYDSKTIGEVNDILDIAKKLLVDENGLPAKRAEILIDKASLKLVNKAILITL